MPININLILRPHLQELAFRGILFNLTAILADHSSMEDGIRYFSLQLPIIIPRI